MPTYEYKAVNGAGGRVRGFEHAATAAALSSSLEERGLLVLEVNDAPDDAASGGGKGGFHPGRRREVLEVTRALAALLPAGMPLAQSLSAAAGVTTGDVRGSIMEIKARVERGETLSSSIEAYPKLFPPMYVGVVRAGERSGDLDGAFTRLSIQLEREEALRGKVLSAAIYPLLLATAGTVAVLILLFFVIPRFAVLLQGTGNGRLPTSTTILLNVSQLLHRFWPVLLIIPAMLALLAGWIKQTPEGRRFASWFLLTMPAVKTLRQYALAARFSRLVGVLIGGGAPLLTALDDTIDSLTDPIAKEHAERIRVQVRDGGSLRAAVLATPIFPPLLAQLVGVGEEAGRLKEFLLKSADIFEERTERATQRLATLAEPAMIVVFGLIVAMIALSLLQAIYGINTQSFK
jgi:type II secretory pathway component PulF